MSSIVLFGYCSTKSSTAREYISTVDFFSQGHNVLFEFSGASAQASIFYLFDGASGVCFINGKETGANTREVLLDLEEARIRPDGVFTQRFRVAFAI
jgi:hypothetical protein